MCLEFTKEFTNKALQFNMCVFYLQPSQKKKKNKIPKIHSNNSFIHGKNVECAKSTFMQCVCDALTNFDRKSVKSRNGIDVGAHQSTSFLKCRALTPPTLIRMICKYIETTRETVPFSRFHYCSLSPCLCVCYCIWCSVRVTEKDVTFIFVVANYDLFILHVFLS